jgi:tetratricopeptide (TPR) repeat protein
MQSRINLSIAEGDQCLRSGDQFEALEIYQTALSNVKELKEENEQFVQNTMGNIHWKIGDSYRDLGKAYEEKAITAYQNALTLLKPYNDDESIISCLIISGNQSHIAKKYEQAESFYREAIAKIYRSPVDYHQVKAKVLRKVGDIYRDQKNYTEAETFYLGDLRVSTDDHDKASTYRKLGKIYQEMQQYEKAEIQYEKALKIKRQFSSKNEMTLVNILNCLGRLYCLTNKPTQAKAALEESCSIITKKLVHTSNRYLITAYKWLARVECQLSQPETALKLLKSVEEEESKLVDLHEKAQTFYHFGIYYEKIKKYISAKKSLREAVHILRDQTPQEIRELLAEVLKKEPKVILSAGLAGTGKRTLFETLAEITHSTYLSKDTVTKNLLEGKPYFGPEYDKLKHFFYEIPKQYALENLERNQSVYLHGYYGTRLNIAEFFIKQGYTVKVIYTHCSGERELINLKIRNDDRDKEKMIESGLLKHRKDVPIHLNNFKKYTGYLFLDTEKYEYKYPNIKLALQYINSDIEFAAADIQDDKQIELTDEEIMFPAKKLFSLSKIKSFGLFPPLKILYNQNQDIEDVKKNNLYLSRKKHILLPM